jgi:predicted RNA polymerase sigma factor
LRSAERRQYSCISSALNGKNAGILEAEKLNLSDNQFYHSLLGNLYTGEDDAKALKHYEEALRLANSAADKATIQKNIGHLRQGLV